MSDVTVAYGERIIHTADVGDTFTLNTEGEYLEDDIVIQVTGSSEIPSATGVSF